MRRVEMSLTVCCTWLIFFFFSTGFMNKVDVSGFEETLVSFA